MLATAAKRRHRRNRYVSIEKRERERERFGSDRRRELLDRGDPRGLNESACSPLVPYSVSFFSFLFSIHRLASSRFPSSPRDRTGGIHDRARSRRFIRQVFRTTDRRRPARNDVKLGRSKGSRGLSRSGTRRTDRRRNCVVAWGKGQGASVFQWNRTRRTHAKVDAGQVEERGKRSCL